MLQLPGPGRVAEASEPRKSRSVSVFPGARMVRKELRNSQITMIARTEKPPGKNMLRRPHAGRA